MSNTPITTRRRRRFAPLALGAGILAVVGVAFGAAPAISGFSAGINNTNNTVASGTLLMSETQGGTTCLSSAAGTVTTSNTGTCGINKFGGSTTAVPGTVYTSTVTITNTGTIPANTFTLTPQGCNQTANGTTNGTATDFCGKVNVTINDDTNTKCVFPAGAAACAAPTSTNTLASLGTNAITLAAPVAPGASRNFTFKVQVDSNASNNYQGLGALEQLNWAFAS